MCQIAPQILCDVVYNVHLMVAEQERLWSLGGIKVLVNGYCRGLIVCLCTCDYSEMLAVAMVD